MTKSTNKVSFVQAVKSAAAAMFGVQSSEQHKQDFSSQSLVPFVLAGLILVIGFVLLLVAIVKAVIN